MQLSNPTKPAFERADEIRKKLEGTTEENGRRSRISELISDDERDELDRFDKAYRGFAKLREKRGRRYANCSFKSFRCEHKGQTEAVSKLTEYGKAADSISSGMNVLLFGPAGSGKDHLLMALAHLCLAQHGVSAMWRQGVDLHEQLRREAFSEKPKCRMFDTEPTERDAPILWISDPLPPTGVLTEFQQAQLFSLIDRRYSDMLPTWVSMNVADGKEAEQRMGAQTVDRLRDGALTIHCRWPSYRKTQEVAK